MSLPEFSDIPSLRSWLTRERGAGKRIGLVPTMGALHEGHLSLVDHARRHAQSVVMSIFVNPLQFGPKEDYSRYPRNLDRDRALAEGRGVHALFVPTAEVMYPPGAETRVVPGSSAERWEGAVRPGHFAGVLTVVAKLFHIVQPDVAVFGQKDIQQAVLIRQMVRDLDWPLELVVAATVREADGLALSSRNAYLDPAQRREARALSEALRAAERAWLAGEEDAARLEAVMGEAFRLHPSVSVDYIAIVDERLAPTARASAGTVLAVAARVGTTRLLDNLILGVEFS
ncbi:MAG TPA: pantoate--beta-alanine ligase [Gemmatimonadales bacterium]